MMVAGKRTNPRTDTASHQSTLRTSYQRSTYGTHATADQRTPPSANTVSMVVSPAVTVTVLSMKCRHKGRHQKEEQEKVFR